MPQTGTTSRSQKEQDGLVTYNILMQESDIKEVYNQTSSTTTVICEIAFEDSIVFLYHMLGYSQKIGTYLSRVCPEVCGWNPNQYAMSAELVKALTWTGDLPLSDDWPGFTRLQYAVTFGAPLYEIIEDPVPLSGSSFDESKRFTVWKKKGAASNEKIPGGAFKIINDALPPNGGQTPIGEVGVRTGRTVSLEAKWLDVPYVNYLGISALANKINDGPVTFDGERYEAETVLFESWSQEPKRNAFGERTFDITFNFLVRQDERTWNEFWKADGTFAKVSSDGTSSGNKVFQVGTLENLFKLA